ncbi:hypothetical protein DRF62_02050 [Chryseobacterium piscium]|uniref:Fibronectin type-III domain-containing protein n=1 Tax=Chryseobacterium piscium TaxID=333702 RepID=A0A3D9BU47_9FLAO|nr:fibronectin type III domain-containing protein [Chryseobacterium piscium]REC56962.1 hypothetical protein DRF62_02050 [Chryseobacterium piscium]
MPIGTFNINQINVNVTDIIPPDNFATITKNGMPGNTYSIIEDNEWRADVEATTQSGIKGVAKPGLPYDPVTNPIPTPWTSGTNLYEKYDVNQSGNFPNFIDVNDEIITVSPTDIQLNEVQIWIKNGVAEKILKAMPQASVNVRLWDSLSSIDFPLTEGNQIIKNNIHWIVDEGQIAQSTDIPGTSIKWIQIGNSESTDDNEFSVLIGSIWDGNKYFNITTNTSLTINKNISQGYLVVKQDLVGNKTLTVEGVSLDINLNPDKRSLIGYILIGTNLMFSINKNLIETTVSIPDSQNPSQPTLTTENITHNSVNLVMTGATDNIGVVGYDIYKDGVFLTSTNSNNYQVTSLLLNTSYEFKVKSKDAAGNVSVFSNTVNPTTLAQALPISLTFSVHDGSFTTLSDGVHRITTQNEVGVSDQTLIGDGYFEFGGNVIGSIMFGLDDVSTLRAYGNPLVWNCHVIVGNGLGANYVNYRNGTQSQQGSPSGILKYRFSRIGTQVKLLKSTDGTNFTDLYTYPNAISGELWLKLSNPVGGTATTEYVKLLNL